MDQCEGGGAADRSGDSGPLVSAVATTYAVERLPDVEELLDSLAAQTYSKLEIIFVAERVPEIADRVRRYAAQRHIANLRVVFRQGGGGLSGARNIGVSEARGDIVAFIDDDAIARHDWVEAIVAVLSAHPAAIGVAGGATPIWEDPAMAWLPEEFFWIISCPVPAWTGVTGIQPVRNAWGVNMAFRREAFARRRFSEQFGVSNRGLPASLKLGLQGDDTEFCFRLTGETARPILFAPACQVFHKVRRERLTVRFTRRHAFWEGYTKATIGALMNRRRPGKRRFALSSEFVVFRRLVCSLLPRAAALMFRHPRRALRQITLALDVLAHFGLGYAAGRVPRLGGGVARHYAR